MSENTSESLLESDTALETLDDAEDVSKIADSPPPEASTHIQPTHSLFLALMLFGCAFLVPWNSFLAAIDYLQLVYPDQRVEFDFSISYMLPNVIGLIIGLFIGPKYSINARLGPGFIVYFCVLTAAPFIGSFSLPYTFLIALLALSGISDAIVQTGGQGYAGAIGLPQAIQAGLGSSGVLASSLRIITKLMLPNDRAGLQRSSTIYFIIANLIVVAGVLAYLWSRRQPQIQALMSAQALHQTGAAAHSEEWRSKVPVNVFSVAKQLWQPLLTIFVTFMITISLFPGTIVQISSTSDSLNAGFWFPVLNIVRKEHIKIVISIFGLSFTSPWTWRLTFLLTLGASAVCLSSSGICLTLLENSSHVGHDSHTRSCLCASDTSSASFASCSSPSSSLRLRVCGNLI
jgi:hypothetical protein